MVYTIKKTEETPYMGCAQYAFWNLDSFDTDTGCGFLVQEVDMVITVDENIGSTHYFEAWKIEKRTIVQDLCDPAEYDDIYCRGDFRSGFEDALQFSIGHSGRVAFYPHVFWVEKGTALYDRVMGWGTSVKEANGLRSVYFSSEWEETFREVKSYEREPFIHTWDFRDLDVICDEIIKYCEKMFRGIPYADENFNLFMKEVSNAADEAVKTTGRTEYKDIVGRVKAAWDNGGSELI